MKALSFSKLAFVCALVLGVIVIWVAAVPSVSNAYAIFGGGGDMPDDTGCACTGTDATAVCSTACGGWKFTGCDLGESTTTCSCANQDQACDDECNVCDAKCD